MKKIFSIASLLLVAALAFTSCSKDETNAPEESVNKSFSIVANLNDTKVTIDNALKSSWSDGDQMNVFHAATGADTYTNDNAFSYTGGKFTGELGTALTDGASYDWYAFYPFSSYIKTPANTSSGYMPVGSNAGVAQVQNGNDNPAHIAGSNYPLVGKVENVANNVVPSVTMKHVCSYAKVVVTNTLSEPIKISKIEVAMPGMDVTGTYFVNFADIENMALTGSGAGFVSDKAVVEVTNGSKIAAGASASFYLGFVPQALVSGDELTVNVTASYPNSGDVIATQENTKNLTSDVEFKAGHIKTLNISYNTPATSASKLVYTLNTTDGLKGANNSYARNCDIESDGITWNFTGNSTINPWRMGGKSLTGVDRTIYTKTAYSSALSKIVVTLGIMSGITVNSSKLIYSTNADFSDATEVPFTATASSENTITGSFPANCYYKIVFNVTVTINSNKYLQLNKIEFYD